MGEGSYFTTLPHELSIQETKPCYLSPIHFSATQSRNTWWQHNLQSLGFDFGHSPPPHTGLLHPEDGQVGLEATLVVGVPLRNAERYFFEMSLRGTSLRGPTPQDAKKHSGLPLVGDPVRDRVDHVDLKKVGRHCIGVVQRLLLAAQSLESGRLIIIIVTIRNASQK